jgi:hypothetical protein
MVKFVRTPKGFDEIVVVMGRRRHSDVRYEKKQLLYTTSCD